MKKKLVSAMLVLSMCSSLVACGNKSANDDVVESGTESAAATTDESAESEISMPADYDATSAAIYEAQLGEFYSAYQTALACDDVDERYALEAIAEAKLMESAVTVPTQTQGGSYAISRVVPYTAPNALWGNDYERYHNVLVVDSEEYTAKDRTVAKKKIDRISKQIEECREYDQVVADLANEKISIDLDDGVKVNYAKFDGVVEKIK